MVLNNTSILRSAAIANRLIKLNLDLTTESPAVCSFTKMAEWYLALAYLKQKKTNDADVILKHIIKNKIHPFFEEENYLYAELKN